MTTDTIKLIIHDCHRRSQQKTIYISSSNLSIDEIKQIGCKTLQINEKKISDFKLYDECGTEMIDIDKISNGDHIYLSNGIIFDIQQPGNIRLCILGEDAVGKSALTLRYYKEQFVADYDPWIEDVYRKNVKIDGNALRIDTLDTAEHGHFEYLRTQWMRNKDGFILLFAINDERSFEILQDFYDELSEVYDDDDIPPFIIVGNKVDLEYDYIHNKSQINIVVTYWYNLNANKQYMFPIDIMNLIIIYWEISYRKIKFEDGYNLAKKWNAIRYIEISAKSGYNVENMFANLVREIIYELWKQQQFTPRKSKHCVII